MCSRACCHPCQRLSLLGSPRHAGWQRMRDYWHLPLSSPLRPSYPVRASLLLRVRLCHVPHHRKGHLSFPRASHSEEVQRQDQAWASESQTHCLCFELSSQHPKPQRPQDTFVATVASAETQRCSVKLHSPLSGAVTQEAQSRGDCTSTCR